MRMRLWRSLKLPGEIVKVQLGRLSRWGHSAQGQRLLPVILLGVMLPVLALLALVAWSGLNPQGPRDVTNIYVYNPTTENWEMTLVSMPVPENPDSIQRPGHRTIEIRLSENNPVKEIIIQEALVINPSDTSGQPLLEIIGHETGIGSGEINIGMLVFKEVDAEQLRIDADVVRSSLENVVAKDDELDLDLEVVNVVRTGRGAASSLFLGVSRSQTITKLSNSGINEITGVRQRGITSEETGLRVDRIRIIGPSSGRAFVEILVVAQSSVFGEIRVENVAIQDLIIKDVSLDDGF